MITIKRIPETDKNIVHWEIYYGKKYLGYFSRTNSEVSVKDVNWVFTTKSDLLYFVAKTKAEIISTVLKQINKKSTILKQHFGLTVSINPIKAHYKNIEEALKIERPGD